MAEARDTVVATQEARLVRPVAPMDEHLLLRVARQQQIALARPHVRDHGDREVVGMLRQEGDPMPIG